MNLTDMEKFNNPEFYIGVIKSISYDTYTITFSIPNIFDKLEKYPEAEPLFPHTYELFNGNPVFIIKMNSIQNSEFYYLPITVMQDIGIFYMKNIIDMSKDGLIKIQSNDIEIQGGSQVNIASGKSDGSGASINLSQNGDIILNGNVIVQGSFRCISGAEGEFFIPGLGNISIDGGIIKGM